VKLKIIHAIVIVCSIIGISLADDSLEVAAQPQEVLKKYENGKYGISFQYPSSWDKPSGDCQNVNPCRINFGIGNSDTDSGTIGGAALIELDKPTQVFE
jgi:hypothetical protein